MNKPAFWNSEIPVKVKTRVKTPRKQNPNFPVVWRDTGVIHIFEYEDWRVVQRCYSAPGGWTMYEEYVDRSSFRMPSWTVFYAYKNGVRCVWGMSMSHLNREWQQFVSKEVE